MSTAQATGRGDIRRHGSMDGTWVQQPVRRSEAIGDYNTHMGGVDVLDQVASSYLLLRRSRRTMGGYVLRFGGKRNHQRLHTNARVKEGVY